MRGGESAPPSSERNASQPLTPSGSEAAAQTSVLSLPPRRCAPAWGAMSATAGGGVARAASAAMLRAAANRKRIGLAGLQQLPVPRLLGRLLPRAAANFAKALGQRVEDERVPVAALAELRPR